ncbi:hypothetical protein GYMLUDRAFT_33580 [Collybiopsis luxurians FD-317 M1]|nr:hypothetical protein GYMLUDRAFT_33580 [Collybiopsis luxurians FD-317 M1]
MPLLQHLENPQDDLTIPNSLNPNFDAELERWQTLNFSNDIMNDRNSNNTSPSSRSSDSDQRNTRSRSHSVNQQASSASTYPRADVQDAVLLAQFAAGAGSSSQPQSAHDPSYDVLLALLQAQSQAQNIAQFQATMNMNQHLYGHHPNLPQPNFSPMSPHLPWPHAQQGPTFPYSSPGMGAQSGGYQNLPPINTSVPLGPASISSAAASSSSTQLPTASSSAASPGSPDDTDLGIPDDKRRRNTAASARFRIKKKLRNLNLERTVSDLTGRADELEREAADLRRENGWLKEIVMLKGSRLAGLDVSPQNLPKPPESDSSFWTPGSATSLHPTGSSSRRTQEQSGQSEQSDSEDESDASSSKGKKESKGKERQK